MAIPAAIANSAMNTSHPILVLVGIYFLYLFLLVSILERIVEWPCNHEGRE